MDTNEMRDLQALAEAAGGVSWSWWTSNSTLRLTTKQAGRHGADGDAVSAHGENVMCPAPYRDFIAAASPATVLALLAEIKRLDGLKRTLECRFEVSEDTLSTIRGCLRSAEADIDQLKADSEALRKDAVRYRFVRSPLGTSSPLAIWNEGKMPLFSGMADAVVDEFMAKEASHARS